MLIAAPVPSQILANRIGKDLLGLPGAVGLSWSRREPDALSVRFATDGFRRLADNVLRDAIDGVRIVFETVDPTPGPGGDAWADSIHTMLAAMRAMPGALSSMTHLEHGMRSAWLKCSDAATAERLRSIINPTIGEYQVIVYPYGVPPKAPLG